MLIINFSLLHLLCLGCRLWILIMFLWLSFCAVMIALVFSALIAEGFGKNLAIKVAAWSMLAALISTQIPTIFPELDGRPKSSVRITPDWTVFDQPTGTMKSVRAIRLPINGESELAQDKNTAAHEDPDAKIDFMPTCGGGERRSPYRLDIAQLNRRDFKQSPNQSPC